VIGVATVRMVAETLRDVATGVEWQLDGFTFDENDTRPERLAAILDPTADDAAVSHKDVPDWPVLVVTAEQPSTIALAGVQGFVIDAPNLLVSVAYATRATVEPAQAWRDADYTMRAVIKALNAGLFAADKGAARTRGPITLVKRNAMTYGPVDVDVPGGKVRGALLLDLYVRDNAT